jgi:hypothetical protein
MEITDEMKITWVFLILALFALFLMATTTFTITINGVQYTAQNISHQIDIAIMNISCIQLPGAP